VSENQLPDPGIYCHLTGFTKKCRDMVVKKGCRKWVRVQGQHPTEDREVHLYDCADQWEIALRHEQFRIGMANADAIKHLGDELGKMRGVMVALDNAKLEAANEIIQGIARHIPALEPLSDMQIKGRPLINQQIEHADKLDG
jgi:hypothetical protein